MSPAPATTGRTPAARRSALVLGGGVVGVTTALFLQDRGYDVTLLERQSDVGQGTSKANGGLVSVGCSAPWNSPATPMTVLRTWGRADSPFLFRASAFPRIVPWALRYLLQCRSERYQRSSEACIWLVAYSLEQLRQTLARAPIQYDRLQNGILKLFNDRSEMQSEVARAETLTKFGLKFQQLSADEVMAMEPTLRSQASLLKGAIYFPDDESGDACKYTQAMAAVCRERGVKIELDCNILDVSLAANRVDGVSTSRGSFKADQYVLALGAIEPHLRRKLKLTLPIYPVKGYSVTVDVGPEMILPRIPFIDWGRKVAVTAFGRRLRVAGTAEFCGYDTTLTPERLNALHRSLIEVFPALRDAPNVRRWAGLRPVTPDGLPILGRSPIENLFLNVGHGPQGWGLSCGSAAVVADIMVGRQPAVSVAPFDYSRFSH